MDIVNNSSDLTAAETIDVDEILDELQQHIMEKRQIAVPADGSQVPPGYEPHPVQKPSWGGILERTSADKPDADFERYHCGR